MKREFILCAGTLVLLVIASPGHSNATVEPPAETTPASASENAKSARAEAGPFRIDVELSGVFEAEVQHEVAVTTEEWATLKVVEAVSHGRRVREGEVLIRFETDKLDEAIEALADSVETMRIDVELAEIAARAAAAALETGEKGAQEAQEHAAEDLKYFRRVGRPLAEKSAEFSLRSSQNFLDYAKEELEQLERMYKEDEITEETEEIILRRQRDAVERALFSLERSRIDRDYELKVSTPRRERALERSADDLARTWQKTKRSLPLELDKAKLTLRRTQLDLKKTEKKLARLREDRERLVVRSPAAGIVYYGRAVRGVWSGSTPIAAKLRKGGSVLKGETLLTVVEPAALRIRSSVPEKDLAHVRKGLKGRAVPASDPLRALPVRVDSVSAIPIGAGTFDATIEILDAERRKARANVVAGMRCQLAFTGYWQPSAVTIPAAAVQSDPATGDAYVYKKGAEGGAEKTSIERGYTSGDRVEIRRGLKAGDEVLLEAPKE